MTMRPIHLFLLGLTMACALPLCAQDHPLGKTPTWAEAIAAYNQLQQDHPDGTQFLEFGLSDVGRPLHLFTMGPSDCLLYTSPSPRDRTRSRMPSSA